MNRRIHHKVSAILFSVCCCFIFSCINNDASDAKKIDAGDSVKTVKTNTVFHKPASTYEDTLKIDGEAAVFYYPDSLQLNKIKAITNSAALGGSIHEYFYMMRNAHTVIKKTYPHLKVIESKQYRYLLFIKKDKSEECIDLNKHDNAYGLFLFDRKKSPVPVDMANIETALPDYMKD